LPFGSGPFATMASLKVFMKLETEIIPGFELSAAA
jgi:hypothetical protein